MANDGLAKCRLFSQANIFFFIQAIHQQLQEALEEQESLKMQIAEYARQVVRVEELLAEKVSLLTYIRTRIGHRLRLTAIRDT